MVIQLTAVTVFRYYFEFTSDIVYELSEFVDVIGENSIDAAHGDAPHYLGELPFLIEPFSNFFF